MPMLRQREKRDGTTSSPTWGSRPRSPTPVRPGPLQLAPLTSSPTCPSNPSGSSARSSAVRERHILWRREQPPAGPDPTPRSRRPPQGPGFCLDRLFIRSVVSLHPRSSVGEGRSARPRMPCMSLSLENFDVAPDSKRFLARIPEVVAAEQPLTAMLNWSATARR